MRCILLSVSAWLLLIPLAWSATSNTVVPTTCSGTDRVSAISSTGVVTCTATSGSGDVTDVGDCATGACFNGSTGSGTTLTFDRIGGDQTLKFNQTSDDFELSNDLNLLDVEPHLTFQDTTPNEDDFHFFADASEFYLTNLTDNVKIFKVDHANNFHIDDPTLVVEATTNRVGIGTTAPAVTLDVVGSAAMSGTLAVTGNTSLSTASLSSTLTLQNGETIVNSTDGTITFGSNNTNPGALSLNFTANNPSVTISNSLGTIVINDSVTDYDDNNLYFGSSDDSSLQWDTAETNDSLKITTGVGTANRSGNILVVELADVNTNFGVPTVSNPTLRIQSADATTTADYIQFFHDQTNPNIDIGNGTLQITGGSVNIAAGDLTLTDPTPSLILSDTVGDTFEWTSDNSVAWFSNTTDGNILELFDANNLFYLPKQATGFLRVVNASGVVQSLSTIPVNLGGTGAAPGADDQILVSDSTVAATWRTAPSGGTNGCSGSTADKVLYNSATNAWSCGSDQNSGGSTAWDAIADPAAGADIAFAGLSETISGNTNDVTAITQDVLAINFTNDAVTDILTQRLLVLNNLSAVGGTTDVLLALDNQDNSTVTTGISIVGSSSGAITTAIDASDAEIVTALDVGSNNLDLGSAGVRITGDGDGSITFLGQGNGSDEDLKIDLDNTSNTLDLTSSTGVTDFTLNFDLNVKDATPTMQLVDTTGSEDDFEWTADKSVVWLSNVTDAKHLLQFDVNYNLILPQLTTNGILANSSSGVVSSTATPTLSSVTLNASAPQLNLNPTSGDTFELSANASIFSLSRTSTTAAQLLQFDARNNLLLPQLASSCSAKLRGGMLVVAGDGTVSCVDRATSFPVFGGTTTARAVDFYMMISGGSSTTTENGNMTPFKMVCGDFSANVDDAPGGSTKWNIVVQDAGASTPLGCTISGASASCTDVHFYTFNKGQAVRVLWDAVGAVASASSSFFGMRCQESL